MTEGQRALFDVDEKEVGRQRVAELRQVLDGERPPAPGPDARRAEREAAIDEVETNNNEWINGVALPFIRSYLERYSSLFAEDLWGAGLPKPGEPKALGAAMRIAAQRGWMEQSGQHRISAQNANPKVVWRSLLCGRPTEEDANA